MVDYLRYVHPNGHSYSELMSGREFIRVRKTDLVSGTTVTLTGYDEDSSWPMVEWIDGEGSTRVTTIDPVMFAEYFIPIIKIEEEWL